MIDPRKLPIHSCEVCGAPTREGKPWCTDHVLTHSPYARSIRAEVEARERCELGARLAEHLVEDAAKLLVDRGGASVARVSRELNVGLAVAERVAAELERRGVGRRGRTKRGHPAIVVA